MKKSRPVSIQEYPIGEVPHKARDLPRKHRPYRSPHEPCLRWPPKSRRSCMAASSRKKWWTSSDRLFSIFVLFSQAFLIHRPDFLAAAETVLECAVATLLKARRSRSSIHALLSAPPCGVARGCESTMNFPGGWSRTGISRLVLSPDNRRPSLPCSKPHVP